MYKNQRRKSGRAAPYDLTSSSISSSRKSGQFISPVTDYDVSYSTVKKVDISTSLLRTTLTDLQNLRNEENDKSFRTEQSDPAAKRADQQSGEKPAVRNEDDDLFDSEIDRFLDANQGMTTETKSAHEKRASGQSQVSQCQPVEEEEYQFSSEFERILDGSGLASQLNRQYASNKFSQLSSGQNADACQAARQDEVDNELSRLNERANDEDDELFDSDAVNNEESDDVRSDDGEEKEEYDSDDLGNDKSIRISNAFLESDLEDLNKLADDELEGDELEDDDLFGVDLDTTLIKSNDPAEEELFTQPAKQFDPNDGDFRTAAGNPVKVRMSDEQQKATAMRLGIGSNFNPTQFAGASTKADDPTKNDELSDEELDLFGIGLDTTLIKSDDPAEEELFTQPAKQFDPNDGDFRTAAGNPVKVQMSDEQQKATAMRLGIRSNFDFKSQALPTRK